MINTHTYDASMDIYRVEETVPKLVEFIEAAKTQEQNALWKYFGITQRAARTDTGSSEDAKLDLLLAELSALREQTDRMNWLALVADGVRTPDTNSESTGRARMPLEPSEMESAIDAIEDFSIRLSEIGLNAEVAMAFDGRLDADAVRVVAAGNVRQLGRFTTDTLVKAARKYFPKAAYLEIIDKDGKDSVRFPLR
jgi:hypothetical protein